MPVTWNRGPWATQQSPIPFQTIATSRGSQPPYASLMDLSGEQGDAGTPGRSMGGQYGSMTEAERGTLSSVTGGLGGLASNAMGLNGLAGGLAKGAINSGVNMGLNAAGVPSPLGALGIMGGLVGAFENYGPQRARGYTSPMEADFASVRDQLGAFAEAAARKDAAERAGAFMDVENATRNAAQNDMGITGPTDPSPEAQGYEGGYTDPGGGGPTGGDSARGSSDQSSDASGQGGAWAKGGVRTFRRPSRPLVGETGDETGIFIPERMKRQGMQGNERQVRSGLQSAYKSLMPRGGR